MPVTQAILHTERLTLVPHGVGDDRTLHPWQVAVSASYAVFGCFFLALTAARLVRVPQARPQWRALTAATSRSRGRTDGGVCGATVGQRLLTPSSSHDY